MDASGLQKQFARIGARLKAGVRQDRRSREVVTTVNVVRDRQGAIFEILMAADSSDVVEVVDAEPRNRHLLLMVRRSIGHEEHKHKFLCGHDERDWFIAAIPERRGVASVRAAIEALKPAEVQFAQARMGIKARDRNRRRNAAFIRQGEWFFIPHPELMVDPQVVLMDEPLTRGGRKPHWAQYLYRIGGQNVYVSRDYPRGLTEAEYKSLLRIKPQARRMRWRIMRAMPTVYVRGKVRHPDHKTVTLDCWHQVLPNTEAESRARQHLTFFD